MSCSYKLIYIIQYFWSLLTSSDTILWRLNTDFTLLMLWRKSAFKASYIELWIRRILCFRIKRCKTCILPGLFCHTSLCSFVHSMHFTERLHSRKYLWVQFRLLSRFIINPALSVDTISVFVHLKVIWYNIPL